MLQQTTVAAVVPFYERFMMRFPSLASLATAPLADVLEHWAGLGYYSRARNLHRAAQELRAHGGFPQSFAKLIELPGFGPYTARAVSSLAFDEKTGVLDGNVIRILSRFYGLPVEWWKLAGRARLQTIADELAQVDAPADLNQGMMELGATICTTQSPACLLCPWSKDCVARRTGKIAELPLRKPRPDFEMWNWRPVIHERDGAVLILPNDYAPFLKGHWIPPGTVERVSAKPARFDFRGGVTRYDIFVCAERPTLSGPRPAPVPTGGKWVTLDDLKKEIPSSLIRKAITHAAAPAASIDDSAVDLRRLGSPAESPTGPTKEKRARLQAARRTKTKVKARNLHV